MIELDLLAGAIAIPLGLYLLMRIGRRISGPTEAGADTKFRVFEGIMHVFIGCWAVMVVGLFVAAAIAVVGYITGSRQ